MDEDSILYDASIVVSFPAADVDDADSNLEFVLDWLEENGYSVQTATLEETLLIK